MTIRRRETASKLLGGRLEPKERINIKYMLRPGEELVKDKFS